MANTGNDFADFFGPPETSSISHGAAGVLSSYFRSNSYNAFVMDDWRAQQLHAESGSALEYFTPWQEKYGHIANLDIAQASRRWSCHSRPDWAVKRRVYPAALIHPDRNDFDRVSALPGNRARSKIVVRAGYGIYYTPNQYNRSSRVSRRKRRLRLPTTSLPVARMC